MNLKVITLIEDDFPNNPELFNEHGLSIYIEFNNKKILFDTGQSGNFIYNAEKLDIDLNKLDYVIISHGHYDHSGGLKKLVDKLEKPNNYLLVGKDFFDKKYKLISDNEFKYIGNPVSESYLIDKFNIAHISSNVYNLTDDIMLFSNFEKNNDYEDVNPNFYIKHKDIYEIDEFKDEIVLAIKLKKGLFVILGCSHIGVVNILETIENRTGMNIYGVIGGTHLVNACEDRLNKTIEYLIEKNIKLIGVSHCTGNIERFKESFGDKFFINNTGCTINII